MIIAKHQELLEAWNVLKDNVRKLLCNADHCMLMLYICMGFIREFLYMLMQYLCSVSI